MCQRQMALNPQLAPLSQTGVIGKFPIQMRRVSTENEGIFLGDDFLGGATTSFRAYSPTSRMRDDQ